jgi:hypothetical protein
LFGTCILPCQRLGRGRSCAHRLDLALAEGPVAEDLGAAVVAERAREDLRGRGRAAVDEHDERRGGRGGAAVPAERDAAPARERGRHLL